MKVNHMGFPVISFGFVWYNEHTCKETKEVKDWK